MASKFFIRLLALFYLLSFAGLAFLFFLFLSQNYREMESLRSREAHLQRMIEVREKELHRKTIYAQRLQEDSDFLERILRQQLGLTAPDEFLFRFEEEDSLFGPRW